MGMGSPSEFKLRYYAHVPSNPGALPQYQPPGGAYVSSPSSAAAHDEGISGSSGAKQVPGTPSSVPSPRVGGDRFQIGSGSAGVESTGASGVTDKLASKKHGSNSEQGGVGGGSIVVVRSPPIADDGCGKHSEDSRGSVDKDTFVPFMAYKSASPQAQSSNRSSSSSNNNNNNNNNNKSADSESCRAPDDGRGVGVIGCGGNLGSSAEATQNPAAGHGEAAKEWQEGVMCSHKVWQESGGESRLENSHHQMSVGDSNLGIDLGCYEEMGRAPPSVAEQRGGVVREMHQDGGVVHGEAIQDVRLNPKP